MVTLSSDAGDWIGDGKAYAYGLANARIQIREHGARLFVQIDGAERWTGEFQLPGPSDQVQTGTFPGLTRYPFQAVGAGALAWSGQSRGCNTLTGTVVVHSATYRAGVLRSLRLDFEQRCDGSSAALRGQVDIDEDTMSRVTVPRNDLPDRPVLALNSEAGDYIGLGRRYAYDHGGAQITVESTGAQLSIRVAGDESWRGDVLLPAGFSELLPGTYDALVRYPFQASGAGGFAWMGEGRGCNSSTSTVVIHAVRYEGGVLRAIDMDFDQHCGVTAALRGQLRWDADAANVRLAPVRPVPAGLWTAPPGSMPATGNAMVFFSTPGDYIGQGWTWSVGSAAAGAAGGATKTASLAISESDGLLKIDLTGDVSWSGQFKAMDALSRLEVGYYGIVKRYPFHNPARGGMAWSMDGRGCNVLSGWFVVDSISYLGGQLQAVDLRFTQYCENTLTPLQGQIRWTLSGSGN